MNQPKPSSSKTWKDKHITRWSTKDVSDWIQKISALQQYRHYFMAMDGMQLTQLEDTQLMEWIPIKTIRKTFKRKIDQKQSEDIDDDNDDDDDIQNNMAIKMLIGLNNLGNSCYLNSTIQVLLSSRAFVEHFRGETHKNIDKDSKLLLYWMDLCKQTAPNCKHKTFSPSKLRNALSTIDRRWISGAQDDSFYVLFNILQVLDEQIQQQQYACAQNMHNNCKEIVFDNTQSDDLLYYNEEDVIHHFLSVYNPYKRNIVRSVFDGILCEELQCGKCQFYQKSYTPFRFFRLSLISSIVTLHDVRIYIPEILGHETFMIMNKCELLSYCSIDILRYIIKKHVYNEYSEWFESHHIKLLQENIKIATFNASRRKNMDKVMKWMNDSNTCDDLSCKTFAVVTFGKYYKQRDFDVESDDEKQSELQNKYAFSSEVNQTNDTRYRMLVHVKITANGHELSYELQPITQSIKLTQKQAFQPLIYMKNHFVDINDVASSDATCAILVVWVNCDAFQLAQLHLANIAKYKNDDSINTIQNIIGYIEEWSLLNSNISGKNSIKNYVFGILNTEFKATQINNNKKSFKHITESLAEYLKSVVLDHKTFALYCKKCSAYAKIIERQRTLCVAPKSLIIFINRCSGASTLYKLTQEIKYDIDEFIMKQSTGNKKVVYDLSGVINHSGTLRLGHYTANVRSIYDTNAWFYTSDSATSAIKLEAVIDRDSMVLIYSQR